MLRLTLALIALVLAAISPRPAAAAETWTPHREPLAVQRLRVNLKTGQVETVSPRKLGKTEINGTKAAPAAAPKKRVRMGAKTVMGGDVPDERFRPATLEAAQGSVFSDSAIMPSAGLTPEVFAAAIMNVRNTRDHDGDGYFIEFDFNMAIDADIYPGYYVDVAAIVVCETTGQEWASVPWRIFGEQRNWVYMPFDETDFAGYLDGNTDLDFTIELYNPFLTTLHDIHTEVQNEPFKADTDTPTLNGAKIYNFANLVDADSDGYYEQFNFDIGINSRVPTGSVLVAAKVLCTTTSQAWETDPWVVVSGRDNWGDVPFSEADFAGRIGLNTNLDFTVELHNTTFTIKHAETTDVKGEPFPADIPQPPPYIVGAKIYNISNLRDSDGDGYFSEFRFDLGISVAVDMGMATVRAKILCPATNQVFITSPWTVSPAVTFWRDIPFDQFSFAQSDIAFGHVALDFTVEIWDTTTTTRYDIETNVAGEPFLIEPYFSRARGEWTLY